MDIEKLEYYIKKKLAGVDYSSIRREMNEEGMSPEEIDLMVPEIDAVVLEITLAKQGKSLPAKIVVGWGIILLSILSLITLFIIGVRGGLIIIALLGTLLSGIAMLSQQRKERAGKFDKFKR